MIRPDTDGARQAGWTWCDTAILTGSLSLALSIVALVMTESIVALPLLLASALYLLVGTVAVISRSVPWPHHLIVSTALFLVVAAVFVTNLSGLGGLGTVVGLVGVAAVLDRRPPAVGAFAIGCAACALVIAAS